MTIAEETAVTASRNPARRRNRQEVREGRTAFFFLLPSLIGVTLFLALPILASVALSFTNWKLLGKPAFVGFDNYIRLFTADPQFWPVLRNTLFFTAEYLVLNIVISLGLAVWISSLKVGQRWFRVIFFLPTFTDFRAQWLLRFRHALTVHLHAQHADRSNPGHAGRGHRVALGGRGL